MADTNEPSAELLPCPFCGGKAHLVGDKLRGYRVECSSIHCFGPHTSKYGVKAEAIAAWNRRVSSAPSFADGVEAAEDMHERAWAQEAERGNLDKAEWHRECAAHLRALVHNPQASSNDEWNPDRLAGRFPAPHFDGETQIPAGQRLTLGQMAAILVGAGMTVDRRAAGGQPASVEAEPVAWRWRPSNETLWCYDPSDDWREKKSGDSRVIFEPLYHQSALASTTLSRPTHRHKKRGTEYVLIGYGRMQAENWFAKVPGPGVFASDHTVDMREVAIYRSATDPTEIWVRPCEEFEDGRFEEISRDE